MGKGSQTAEDFLDSLFGSPETISAQIAKASLRYVEMAEEHIHKMQSAVDSTFAFQDYLVDETAVILHSSQTKNFVRALVGAGLGWVMSDHDTDRVRIAGPLIGDSSYVVEYDFLTHPEKPWRIEVMGIIDGFSPLHRSLLDYDDEEDANGLETVHYSFKVPGGDVLEFQRVCDNAMLSGWTLCQTAVSSYGAFSYFRPRRDNEALRSTFADGAQGYLKIRMNNRDAEPAVGTLTSDTATAPGVD